MTARVIRDDARMTTARDTRHAELRRAVSLVADAAMIVCDAIDEDRPDDDIDAAMDTLRRATDNAMAVHMAMRTPGAGL